MNFEKVLELVIDITTRGFIIPEAHDYLFWYRIREAVLKQIRKKPGIEGDGYSDGEIVYDTWICPNCHKAYELDIDEFKYCPECGQAIDWSGKNEMH